MTLAAKFLGISPVTGQSLQGDANSVAAAGSSITDATATKTAQVNVTSGTGGIGLYAGIVGDWQVVYNSSGAPINVYPPASTSGINQITDGSPMILQNNTACLYFTFSATQILAFLSA